MQEQLTIVLKVKVSLCGDHIMKKHNTIMFSEKNIKYSKIVYIQWDSKP